jgi:hypothetical protein
MSRPNRFADHCRRTARVLFTILAIAAGLSVSPAQIVRTEDALVALFGLQTGLEVEQRILRREEARYEENIVTRAALQRQIATVYAELEEIFRHEQGEFDEDLPEEERPSLEEIRVAADAKEAEVRILERAEAAAREEGREIRDEIRRIRMRIGLLSEKIRELESALPQDRESVTGIWDIALMPSGDRGVFALWQSGTIISGQYVLDGPFRGSLEGTLINRQLLIRRIDATLGRSMEFSGYLSDDGQSVQGTYMSYDLSSGRAPTGSWSARKRSSRPSDTSPTLQQQPRP